MTILVGCQQAPQGMLRLLRGNLNLLAAPSFSREVRGLAARTRRGQSGSAVMRHVPEETFVRRVDGAPALNVGSHSQIIGVYSGRTSGDSDLGYVWRVDEVDVICRDGVLGTD